MALINCPECGRQISSRAHSCPHCGATNEEKQTIVEHHGTAPATQKAEQTPKQPRKRIPKKKLRLIWISSAAAVALLGGLGWLLYHNHQLAAEEEAQYEALMDNFSIADAETFLLKYPDNKHQKDIRDNIALPNLDIICGKGGKINKKIENEMIEKGKNSLTIKMPGPEVEAGSLSGGNQQKVVVAKWLTMEPELLIVDEPTRGIDVGSKAEIYEIINDLAKAGMAIIVVSSEIEEIFGVCDSVITIFEGAMTAQLPITDDLTREKVLACSLGGSAT